MSDHNENLEKMMRVWNTPDRATRERLVDEAMEHNVHFADPNHNIVGRAGVRRGTFHDRSPSASRARRCSRGGRRTS